MKSIGIIKRISHLLSPQILKNLYYALIHPYLNYCNLIWTSTYPTHLDKLQILQKKAIRVITNSSYNSHTKTLFHNLNVLTINQIRQVQTYDFMFRYERNLLPSAFNSFFPTALLTTQTRSNRTYICPYPRTNTRKFSIGYQGPLLWNNLPNSIKTATGFSQYKCLTRAFIQQKEYVS